MTDVIKCGGALSVSCLHYVKPDATDTEQRISVHDDGYPMIALTLDDALDVAAAIVQLVGDNAAFDTRRRRVAAELDSLPPAA
jgi:hypothetical protein